MAKKLGTKANEPKYPASLGRILVHNISVALGIFLALLVCAKLMDITLSPQPAMVSLVLNTLAEHADWAAVLALFGVTFPLVYQVGSPRWS